MGFGFVVGRVFEGKVLNELRSFFDSGTQVRAASTDV